jgi:hypothetical protein
MYNHKYIKYKNRYLNLKKILNGGGELNTIDDINNDIFKKYPGVSDKPLNIIEDKFGEMYKNDILKLTSNNTSINKFDCLIHSFLDNISENFRKLTNEQKNEYASWFRREYFYSLFTKDQSNKIYKFLNNESLFDKLLDDIKPVVYLSGYHALLLAELYKINIIIITKNEGKYVSAVLGKFKEPTIIIYNPGDGHFRSVKKNDSNKFIFDSTDNEYLKSIPSNI